MKLEDRTPPRPQPKPPGAQWEYRSKLMERDADLTQYGAEGWECYAVVAQPADMCMFYFRRRR